MKSNNLISISECLELWAKKSSIELPDLRKPADKSRKVKIGRNNKGNLLSVDFKYLDNNKIEIIKAAKI